MSGKFDGFSEADINKLTTARSNKTKKSALIGRSGGMGIRRMPDNYNNNNMMTNTSSSVHKPDIKTENCSPNEICNFSISSVSSLEESIHFRPLSAKISDKKNDMSDESILHIEQKQDNPSTNNNNVKETVITSSSPFRGISLKDFEAQRKMIEEQNKQKKDMLYKAIELHSQKTAAEVKKIEQIKAELAKLDSDLAVDVAILRKQIEAACIHYANIQKHYDRIESQFLKAKLDLHNASERKELLTEHLCTVIAHNEDRKAKKLSELMEKVGLTPSGEMNNSKT